MPRPPALGVNLRLRNEWANALRDGATGDGVIIDAHAALEHWGNLIRSKWTIDNLHLTTRVNASESARIMHAVQAVQELLQVHGVVVARQTTSVTGAQVELSEMKNHLAKLHAKMVELTSVVSAPAAPLSAASHAPPPSPSADLSNWVDTLPGLEGKGLGQIIENEELDWPMLWDTTAAELRAAGVPLGVSKRLLKHVRDVKVLAPI